MTDLSTAVIAAVILAVGAVCGLLAWITTKYMQLD
jgi:hypothetical protein